MSRTLRALCFVALTISCGRKPVVSEYRIQSNPPSSGPGFSSALYQSVNATVLPGNSVQIANNGSVFDAQVAEIGKAQRSIHIVTFIWADGAVSDRLIEAIGARSKAGVACRVIVDALGTPSFGTVEKKLNAVGCETHTIRPLPGQDDGARVHRKLVIIDGNVGIAGGFGIDDKWQGNGLSEKPPEWRDSNVVVRGPIVRSMQQAFAENWQEAGGQLLPQEDIAEVPATGSMSVGFVTSTEQSVSTHADRVMQLLLASASKRIWVANAYFVPSKPIMELLERKAKAGVDVRVLAAGAKTDTKEYLEPQRQRMDELMKSGVRTFEYAPVMMHTKMVIVDDRVVMVGSINLDALSLNKQDEDGVIVDDAQFNTDEAQHFTEDLGHADERKP
jgi:cardiolipin synthase